MGVEVSVDLEKEIAEMDYPLSKTTEIEALDKVAGSLKIPLLSSFYSANEEL